jgi:2-methylcitrate dehydratase PrpD
MHAYLKVHPTCAHQHGINDAVVNLIAAHRIAGSDVARVEIATYAHGLAYDNHVPQTALAARFSAALTTAIALHRGGLGYDAITAAALADPAVRDLAARIHVYHDPALDQHYPAGRPARVTITLKDGREVTETCLYPRGDHTNPTTRAERRDKVRALFALRFGSAHSDRLIAAFDDMLQKASLGTCAPLANFATMLRSA